MGDRPPAQPKVTPSAAGMRGILAITESLPARRAGWRDTGWTARLAARAVWRRHREGGRPARLTRAVLWACFAALTALSGSLWVDPARQAMVTVVPREGKRGRAVAQL